jgi:hypothetical protein
MHAVAPQQAATVPDHSGCDHDRITDRGDLPSGDPPVPGGAGRRRPSRCWYGTADGSGGGLCLAGRADALTLGDLPHQARGLGDRWIEDAIPGGARHRGRRNGGHGWQDMDRGLAGGTDRLAQQPAVGTEGSAEPVSENGASIHFHEAAASTIARQASTTHSHGAAGPGPLTAAASAMTGQCHR